MTQNKYNKILSALKSSVIILLMLAGVFGRGFIKSAIAAGICQVQITSMEAVPTRIYKGDSAKFNTIVNTNGCSANNIMEFDFIAPISGSPWYLARCQVSPPVPNNVNIDCPFNLSNFSRWSDVTKSGSDYIFPYYLDVHSSLGDLGDTKNWGKQLNVSNNPLGEGFNFTVSPPTAKIGDTLKITYTDFPPGAQGNIYVNDNNHFVAIYSGGNQIAVNATNGFISNGDNKLRFVLTDSSGKGIYDQTYTLTQATGASGNAPTVVLSPPAANSTYAPGTTITISATNMPSGGILLVHAGNQDVKLDSSKQWSQNFTLDANSGFNISGVNSIVATPVAADGTTALNGVGPTTFNITVSPTAAVAPGASCTGGPGQQGTCSSGQICSAATGGTCSAAGTPSTANCTGPDANNCLYNPLPVDSLTATLLLIMRAFLGVIALWSVAFIVIGGFRYVMSQGNEEAVTAARKTITWAILGLAIALLSFSIIAIVQYILQTQIQNVSQSTSMIRINRNVGMSECRNVGMSDKSEVG